jgi:hypothetical protein
MEGEGLTETFRKWNYLHNVLDFTLDSWAGDAWDASGGSVADDTSIKLWGDKSIKCSMSAQNHGMHVEYVKDMSGLPDTAPTAIRIYLDAANKAKMAADSRIRVRFLCDSKPTTTNRFSKDIDKADFTNDGWNYFIIKEDDWDEYGSPSWANIKGMEIYYNSAGATHPTSSMDIYVQYDAIQRIRIDPDNSDQYSYFQKQIDNGVYENSANRGGISNYILGLENNEISLKDLGVTNSPNAITFKTVYSSNNDFIIKARLKLDVAGNSSLIQWRNDNNNRTGAYFEANNFRIFSIINASSTDIGTAITTAVGDIIDITVIKNEKNWSFLLKVNGVMQDISGLSQTSFNTNYQNLNGKLAIQELAGNPCYIESATITSTKVADHANTADRAYRILQPSCRVYNNANISISDSTSTALTFNSERWDNNEIHNDADTAKLRCRETGLYSIILNISFASNATGRRNVWIELNGSDIIASVEVEPSQSDTTRIVVSTQYRLEKGDYLKAKVYQSSGGALNVLYTGNYSPEFMMTKISD